jgi:hypothetical protein
VEHCRKIIEQGLRLVLLKFGLHRLFGSSLYQLELGIGDHDSEMRKIKAKRLAK